MYSVSYQHQDRTPSVQGGSRLKHLDSFRIYKMYVHRHEILHILTKLSILYLHSWLPPPWHFHHSEIWYLKICIIYTKCYQKLCFYIALIRTCLALNAQSLNALALLHFLSGPAQLQNAALHNSRLEDGNFLPAYFSRIWLVVYQCPCPAQTLIL